jgi:hypothetical protein
MGQDLGRTLAPHAISSGPAAGARWSIIVTLVKAGNRFQTHRSGPGTARFAPSVTARKAALEQGEHQRA